MKHLTLAGLVLAGLLLVSCGRAEAPTAPPEPPAPVVVAPPPEVKHAKPVAKPVKPKAAKSKAEKSKKVKPVARKAPPKTKAAPKPKKTVDEAAARRDCTGDALRLCTFTIPQGREAIIGCMVANRKNLSKQCLGHFT